MSTNLTGFAKDMTDLQIKHPDKMQQFMRKATHIEGTDQCQITLPCSYKDKTLMILVSEI
jgi:hypothetical protein